jgi:hypothetical protein
VPADDGPSIGSAIALKAPSLKAQPDYDAVAQADSLFRAAPDLLAALSELLAESDEFHNPHTEGWNMARLAIAKATGNAA